MVQLVHSAAAAVAAQVPTAHVVHTDAPGAAAVPGELVVEKQLEPAVVAGRACAQATDVDPLDAYPPVATATQDDCPVSVWVVPGRQAVHAFAPDTPLKVPMGQGRQLVPLT